MKSGWLLTTALVVVLSILATPIVAQDWCYNYGVSITETEIENDVVNVIYISSEIIMIQTDGYQTYRSGDEGKSWDLLTTPAQDAFRYVIPSANTSWIYFSTFSYTTQFYTSTDGGETLVARTSFPKNYFVEDIKPHPTLPEWALARMSQKCTGGNCHEELYYTKDFGITWNFIESYVGSTYEWGETIINYEDPSNNHILIFYQTTNNKNGSQDPGLQLLKRYDVLFNSINEVIFTGVNNFFKLPYNDSLLFVTREDPQVNVQLLISEDAGDSWTPAIFPFQLPFQGIEILDGSEGAVLLSILHDAIATYGNIYISDAYTSEFSLVLKNSIRTGSYFYGASDFIKVENLHGIYVANVYEQIEDQVSLNKIKTLVTFDFGGEWTRINPPVNDSNGQPIQCLPGEQCFLNLYGLLENMYGRFYSSQDAIGLLLATGNVGEYLSSKTNELNTYMSRDAGWSWTEVSKGSLVYEMGDQGGILLFAENSVATNTMLYTWTEGLTFTECLFTNGSNVDITNIVVEPSYTSEKFLMYGSRGSKGVLIHVDFSGVQPRPCQNPEMAGTNSSDYELWSPSDLVTDDSSTECLLGAHRVYTRRKRDAECFNPPGYTPKVTVTGCACTIEDYDCDYCWETNADYACVYVCIPPYDEAPIPCNDYYYVTQGYRRIPGDNCNASAGLNLLPQRFECPPQPSQQSSSQMKPKHTGAIVAAVFVTIAVLALVIGGLVSWKLKKPAALWKKKETNYTMVATDEFEDVE